MSLFNLSPAEFCDATNACAEGRDWAITQPTMADVWDNCPQIDWLLWIADRLDQRPDDCTLRLFAVWCARNTPLGGGLKTGDLLTDSRSLAALEVAERFAYGNATLEELGAAWDTASAVASAAAPVVAREAAASAAVAAASAVALVVARDAASAAAAAAPVVARAAAEAAQAAHFRTIVPNPFREEAQS